MLNFFKDTKVHICDGYNSMKLTLPPPKKSFLLCLEKKLEEAARKLISGLSLGGKTESFFLKVYATLRL